MVKQKMVQRQQMGQALVELRCKAVSMQQTGTVRDSIYVAVVSHTVTSRITRRVKAGGRTRDRRMLPNAGASHSAGSTTLLPAETLWVPTPLYSALLCREK